MNRMNCAITLAVSAVLASGLSFADVTLPIPPRSTVQLLSRPRPAQFKPRAAPRHAAPSIPAAEMDDVATTPNAGFNTSNALAATSAAATGTVLTPPVTLSYAGTSTALAVTDTGNGSGKGISALINNTASTGSALYGQTNGKGAGLTGYNGGTAGPAGKFGVTNSSSTQAAVYATTNGTGSAVSGTNTATNDYTAAVFGTSTAGAYGVGVEGDGGTTGYGVYGLSRGTGNGVYGLSFSGVGVYGATEGTECNCAEVTPLVAGVQGESSSAIGVYGDDNGSGTGVYGVSSSGPGVVGVTFGTNNNGNSMTTAFGVEGESTNAVAVYGNESSSGIAILGEALTAGAEAIQGTTKGGRAIVGNDTGDGYGLYGISVSGYGLYAYSQTGTSAYIVGNAVVTGTLSVNGMNVASDRNLKSNFAQVDGDALLGKIDALPISSWDYKTAPNERHIGPMAQDFHAAFGLNGVDDTHISEVDIVGVSLAAIQELNRKIKQGDLQLAQLRSESDKQLRQRDSEIAVLKAQTTEQATRAQVQATQIEAQAKALSDLAAVFSARMTALESQRGVSTQTVALKDSAVGRSGATE